MSSVLIYGAYGYTGRLIVQECLRQGINPALAGRNAEKLSSLAKQKGLEYHAFDLQEGKKLNALLSHTRVMIHCAGPFVHTAREAVEACLATDTHYLDISGEYQVFDLIQGYSDVAKDKGIMLMPGVGFDVVPTDCLASFLKSKLPTATHLQLAFASKGGRMSRGTSKTMIENLGEPQALRKEGVYAHQLMGSATKEIDYGAFKTVSVGISWGDISTAFFSTGIPNIEVYTGTTKEQVSKIKKMIKLSFLLKARWVKNFLQGKIDKKSAGPSDQERAASSMYLWGQVKDGSRTLAARMTTPNGYTLTAQASVLIAQKVLNGQFMPGYQTPSSAYGHDLILEVDGVERTRAMGDIE